jgi:hypothetical protein
VKAGAPLEGADDDLVPEPAQALGQGVEAGEGPAALDQILRGRREDGD